MITINKDAVPTLFKLEDDGDIPNSPLPLVLYKRALDGCGGSDNPEKELRSLMKANKWDVQWTWSIYKKTHLHSTAHEGLAIVQGSANVQFGGPRVGKTVTVGAGDFVIIPAGVAHMNMGSSSDFCVVGMYPSGQKYDILWTKEEWAQGRKNIPKVPRPKADPLFGRKGPLMRLWS